MCKTCRPEDPRDTAHDAVGALGGVVRLLEEASQAESRGRGFQSATPYDLESLLRPIEEQLRVAVRKLQDYVPRP